MESSVGIILIVLLLIQICQDVSPGFIQIVKSALEGLLRSFKDET